MLGHCDEIAGNGLSPNVIAEHLRSKYELSVLQQVILLQRRESLAYQNEIDFIKKMAILLNEIDFHLITRGRASCGRCARSSTSLLLVI